MLLIVAILFGQRHLARRYSHTITIHGQAKSVSTDKVKLLIESYSSDTEPDVLVAGDSEVYHFIPVVLPNRVGD